MNMDLTNCERENVCAPQFIQYGAMLIADKNTQSIVGYSENISEYLGRDADLVETKVGALFSNFDGIELDFDGGFGFVYCTLIGATSHRFESAIHCVDDEMVIELNKIDTSDAIKYQSPDKIISIALEKCDAKRQLDETLQIMTEIVRELTDFDRVMVYRFNHEFDGQVVAESKKDGIRSYIEHRFPEGDIPAPARAVYQKNYVRTIPNMDNTPINIMRADTKKLDMTKAILRGVSPMHIEYMNNMGEKATMSLSLIVGGKLWGLIACHHRSPRYMPFALKHGMEILAKIFSKEIETREFVYVELFKNSLLDNVDAFEDKFDFVSRGNSLKEALFEAKEHLFKCFNANGMVAILNGKDSVLNEYVIYGKTPKIEEIEEINEKISQRFIDGVFFTECLRDAIADGEKYRNSACGLLALRVEEGDGITVLWFLAETIDEQKWGGNPIKNHTYKDGEYLINPRKSFETWINKVEYRARKVHEIELLFVDNLKKSLTKCLAIQGSLLNLREAVAKTKEQEQFIISQSRSAMMGEMIGAIAHQLKNPLNELGINIQDIILAQTIMGQDSAEMVKFKNNSMTAIRKLARMIDDFRNFFAPNKRKVKFSLQESISSCFYLLGSQLKLAHIEVVIDGDVDCNIIGYENEFEQVIVNLMINAKEAIADNNSDGGNIFINLIKEEKSIIIKVSDDGGGVPSEHLSKIFDSRYSTKEYGTGIGLYLAKLIIEERFGEEIYV